jgi:hypothetical protein
MKNIDHPSDNECTLFFRFHRRKFALFTSANRNSYLQEEKHYEYKVIVKWRNRVSHISIYGREREREWERERERDSDTECAIQC